MKKNKATIYTAVMIASSLLLAALPARANPAYDHVVIVVEENHGYEQIVGSPDAPYINNTLIKDGILITNGYGEQHPSQPNYFWLFSGSNQGITTDNSYWPPNPAGPVFNSDNLYTALEQKFPSSSSAPSNFFGGYVDSGTQSPVSNYYADTDNYANRHVPWLGFTNINNGNPAGITKDFSSDFPSGAAPDYSQLPKVSIITPALNHDMHDYDSLGHGVNNSKHSSKAVSHGDSWLQKNISGYAEWAKTHNSLLIITFDEDSTSDWPTPFVDQGGGVDGGANQYGLTAPTLNFTPSGGNSGPNHIAIIFYGANLSKHGLYSVPGAGVNNVNILRTIESFYHLKKSGAQTPLAVEAGMNDDPITGIFIGHDRSATQPYTVIINAAAIQNDTALSVSGLVTTTLGYNNPATGVTIEAEQAPGIFTPLVTNAPVTRVPDSSTVSWNWSGQVPEGISTIRVTTNRQSQSTVTLPYQNLGGVVWTQKTYTEPQYGNQKVNVLTVDPTLVTLKSVETNNRPTNYESVLSMGNRTHALAGINGGFFCNFNGGSNDICASPGPGPASCSSEPSCTQNSVDGLSLLIVAGQKPSSTNCFLRTAFGLSSSAGVQTPQIKQIAASAGWPGVDYAIGAGPNLVTDHMVNNTGEGFCWNDEAAARTAVAKTGDGKILLVTVDKGESADGMTTDMLASFLIKEFNAESAMNFDGGGSTTMYFNGAIVNKPSDTSCSDKSGRCVYDGLFVYPK